MAMRARRKIYGSHIDPGLYRLGKYRENTNRYHTEIPNRDTTLVDKQGKEHVKLKLQVLA
jgi:hypothetical protein